MTRHIPNFITTLNLASGFISVILILNGNIISGSWLIILAMAFDFLDGFSARLLHAYSDMGKELDSLADLVSFGVAPGLIIYSVLSGITVTSAVSLFAVFIPTVMVVCGGLRLARFNTDTEQSLSFKGLPIPASALVVVSLVLSDYYSESNILTFVTGSPVIMSAISTALSLLMVSRIDLLALKFTHWGIRGNEPRYILIAATIISLVVAGIAALPLVIPYYISISVISGILKSSVKG